MRYLYTVLFYLILPVVLLRLLWRSIKQPAYRQRIHERFGFYSKKCERSLWVHAVSVGEVIAAVPIIQALKSRYPDLPIVVTTMTPTGAERVHAILGNQVTHVYLPYDLPPAVQRFLSSINPIAGIMMETELWPNLFMACRSKNVPVCLMNARLSASSAKGYQWAAAGVKEMLQSLALIAANEKADAERFIALGADPERVVVTGNIKFDLALPSDLEAQRENLHGYLGDRFVWVAASTHAGEEEQILAAHRALLTVDPKALLILAPRHPNRFDQVATLCDTSFLLARRSHRHSIHPEVSVYLSDTMGELLLLYSVADVAFVGGSLVPHGGHNILEPALLRKPILTGPHLKNFEAISELFLSANALIKVNDATQLGEALIALREDHAARESLGNNAFNVMSANRGALERQIALLDKIISCTRNISLPTYVA